MKVAYSGSTYTDDFSSYTVENPFCPTGAVNNTCARNGSVSSPTALMSLWPSNQANGMSTTMGADLPFNTRYMGTVAYTNMRQNDAFLPFTLTPFSTTKGVPPGWQGGSIPVNSTAALPASSLNGSINTLLSNNVITAQLTPELKFKGTYRYYNYDNGTPSDQICRLGVDRRRLGQGHYNQLCTGANPLHLLHQAECRQRAQLAAVAGMEHGRGLRLRALQLGVCRHPATNENSAKAYVDWKPTGWITARASVLAGQRRSQDYDNLDRVGLFQWPTPRPPAVINTTQQSTAYRQFMFDNRDRTIAKGSVDVDVFRGVTLTPTFSVQRDDYRLDPTKEVGLNYYKSMSAGVELAWLITPGTRFLVSYMNDRRNQLIYIGWAEHAAVPRQRLLQC